MLKRKIAQIMSRDILQVSPEQTLRNAAEIMRAHSVSSLLVTRDGKPVGVFTEQELLTAIERNLASDQTVGFLMRPGIPVASENSDCRAAFHRLLSGGGRHLLVVNAANEPVGIVSETDFRHQVGLEDFLRLRDVAGAMNRNPLVLPAAATVAEAAGMMQKKRAGCVLVGEKDTPDGIVSERDMVQLFCDGKGASALGAVMHSPLIGIPADATLQDAARLMNEQNIRRLVVLDDDNRLLGVLHEHDIVKHIDSDYVELLQSILQEQNVRLQDLAHAREFLRLKQIIGKTEGQFRALIDYLPHKMFIKDTELNYLACNESYARDLQRIPEQVVGHSDFDFFPAELARRYRDDDVRVLREELSLSIEEPYLHDGQQSWIHTRKMPWYDPEGKIAGVVGVFEDITEFKRLNAALERKSAMYAVLSKTNSAIVHATDRQSLFDTICRVALEIGGFRLVWIGMETADQSVMPVAVEGEASDYIRAVRISTRPDEAIGQGPTGTSIRENRPIAVQNFAATPATAPWHAAAQQFRLGGSMSLPLVGGQFRGALMVYAAETDFFDADVQALLLEMASDVSFALQQFHEAEEKQKREAQMRLLSCVFEGSAEGMMITDAQNRIVMVNPAFTEITGYSPAEVTGHVPSMLHSDKHDDDFYREMWTSLERADSWQGEVWNRRKDGNLFVEWLTISTLRDKDGNIVNYLAIFSNLANKNAAEELNRLKQFDPLTGLPNQLLLEDRVKEAIRRASDNQEHVALLFANLDNFHTVNELLGHEAGDRVLCAVAQRFGQVIDGHGTVSRLSGDTFVMALPALQSVNEVEPFAVALLDSMQQPFLVAGETAHLSARIGIAVYPEDAHDFSSLMQRADAALLDAKIDGRNTYRFFDKAMNDYAKHLFTVTNQLRTALDQQHFVLYYQPQICLQTWQIIGFEALIRIQHPHHGLLQPAGFIPVAEETGLIIPIGEWVLEEACRQMKQWVDELGLKDMVMAVNLSSRQIAHAGLLEAVDRALAKSGLAPQLLELELTESALMQSVDAALRLMQDLRGRGIQLAIDDFGTGYSSLSYLKQFPVKKLKIDQSFVRTMLQNKGDASIVKAIVAMAQSLNLRTIAEGVETEEGAAFLRVIGCDEMQGYFFSRPLPAGQIKEVLSAQAGERS